MKPNVNIALLGFGTVAGGTYDIFRMNRETISSRTGIDFRVRKILVRDKKRPKRTAYQKGPSPIRRRYSPTKAST